MTTEAKFKKGDRVRCTDASDGAGSLAHGREYEVESWKEPLLQLVGHPQLAYGTRFVLVTPAPVEGGKAACCAINEGGYACRCAAIKAAAAQPAPKSAEPIRSTPDRYTQHREHWAGEGAVMLKSWHESNPGNQAARLRNVAALRAEFDLSSDERRRRLVGKVHEGRSERALPRTNGDDRGRETGNR